MTAPFNLPKNISHLLEVIPYFKTGVYCLISLPPLVYVLNLFIHYLLPSKQKIYQDFKRKIETPASMLSANSPLIIRAKEVTVELNQLVDSIEHCKWDITECDCRINELLDRLRKEEDQRIIAENKSSMIQNELERLRQRSSTYNVEFDNLKQSLKEASLKLDLLRATTLPDHNGEATQKIESIIAILRSDHQASKAEIVHLQEFKKILHDLNTSEHTQHLTLKLQIAKLEQKYYAETLFNATEYSDSTTDIGYQSSNHSTPRCLTPHHLDGFEDDDDGERASDSFLKLYALGKGMTRKT